MARGDARRARDDNDFEPAGESLCDGLLNSIYGQCNAANTVRVHGIIVIRVETFSRKNIVCQRRRSSYRIITLFQFHYLLAFSRPTVLLPPFCDKVDADFALVRVKDTMKLNFISAIRSKRWKITIVVAVLTSVRLRTRNFLLKIKPLVTEYRNEGGGEGTMK